MSEAPPLSPEEIERYARHIILAELGGAGQQKLKKSRVLVIGAGGLGSPLLTYLAGAGIGTLGIVDDDRVSLSNLQRQVIFDTDLVGTPKVEAAAERIRAINPNVRLELHNIRVDASNAQDIISRFDIIADGSDNFDTRYLVADTCENLQKNTCCSSTWAFRRIADRPETHSNTTVMAYLIRPTATCFRSARRKGWSPLVLKRNYRRFGWRHRHFAGVGSHQGRGRHR